MAQIFINYRREDSAYVCDRIYEKLREHFGKESIFFDIKSIPLGIDFDIALKEAAGECALLLAVIGERWLTVKDKHGHRRIDDPNDYVVKEINYFLGDNRVVIPILIEGVKMTDLETLPGVLTRLIVKNALDLGPGKYFDNDMKELISSIEKHLGIGDPIPTMPEKDIVHEVQQAINIVSMSPSPDTTKGIPLYQEEQIPFPAMLKRFLEINPSLKSISGREFIKHVDILGVNPDDFLITVDQHKDNSKQILAVSMHDKQSRLQIDDQDWKLNLLRFSRHRDNFIELYHNGDNSLKSPFREGSYGRNAPYSIVRYAVQQFPELKSTDPDLVYLGSLPQESQDLTGETFAGVRRRLAIYRFARWLWLWNHPRRGQ